jgi:hypothetical protein
MTRLIVESSRIDLSNYYIKRAMSDIIYDESDSDWDVILYLFLNLETKSPSLVRYIQILEYSTVTHPEVSDVLITYSCMKLLIEILLTIKNYNGMADKFSFFFD